MTTTIYSAIGFTGMTVTTSSFQLAGGNYMVTFIDATGNSLWELEYLLPNGTSWQAANPTPLPDVYTELTLPAGEYRFGFVSGTPGNACAQISLLP